MPAKHQFVRIRIPAEYEEAERLAIGQEIITRIRERTARGIDKDGDKFKGYSEDYKKSLNFKIAGKSASEVNLRLSGEMLAELDLLAQAPGVIEIGYVAGSEANAKADGNIRGTYGQSRSTGKARNFLGVTPDELGSILSRYPQTDRTESQLEAQTILRVSEAVRSFLEEA
jgi:hypothetical protein